MKDEPYRDSVIIIYCYRKHDGKYATKREGSIDPRDLINKRKFINVMGFPGLIHIQGLYLWNIIIVYSKE